MSLNIGVYGARAIPSTYSGYETFLTTLLPGLVERGHDVTMYCRSGEGVDASDWNGVHRVVLPSLSGKSTSTLSHSLVAARASRSAKHDVILTVNVANAFATALNRSSGQSVVMNVDGQEWLRGKWGPFAKLVFKTAARMAKYTTTAPVVDCAAMAEVYRREFRTETTVLPYCAPTIEYTPSTETLLQYNVLPGEFFVTGGRLNPENNIDRIARAYLRTDLAEPLFVLGKANYDSPVSSALRDLAAADPRIRLLGHLGSRSEFFDVLRGATAYIHGHSVGGMNPSLIEAMYVGSRILAFDTAFNRDTLGPDGDYFVFENEGLRSKLNQIRFETEDHNALSRSRTSSRVDIRFPAKAVIDAYEELLTAAAGKSSRSRFSLQTEWATRETYPASDAREPWRSTSGAGTSQSQR